MTELLAPAGGEQSAYIALEGGADAVYLGLNDFSARAGAENFDVQSLERTARFAHVLGAKVYVALNTLVKDAELPQFFALAKAAWQAGADAILLQDVFLGQALKNACPEIVLHLSTQAGCCNVYGAELAKACGFSRAVLARETPIEEIAKISAVIETEVFVQGALCTCFSGQCYFSSFAGNMSGNRGRCKQPCRKKYTISRSGFEEPSYALSLSDLSVGDRIKELIAAGVSSLKIEGRMRRPEYVAAAVKYYRELLGGGNPQAAFDALRRAYNRGDYTQGLAFGQDRMFLSQKVQGHIGAYVGNISYLGGKYFCKSDEECSLGDGFKILRDGKEVGGAVFSAAEKNGFYLQSKSGLKNGDEVRLTTSVRTNAALLNGQKKRRAVTVELEFIAGCPPVARCREFTLTGDCPLSPAERAPLTQGELVNCFKKVDSLPFNPEVSVITDGVFMQKSALNGFRREFYRRLTEKFCPARREIYFQFPRSEIVSKKQTKRARIVGDGAVFFDCKEDILIYKPDDYNRLDERFFTVRKEKYLYLPPYFTSEDERTVVQYANRFDGVYCDGYYGFLFAQKYGVKLFAGTGCNLSNAVSVCAAVRAGAEYFAVSKELSRAEQDRLAACGAFALTAGEIKVMDLIYCPFSRTCSRCDRQKTYIMTDQEGRKFPLKSYRVSGKFCRFEVYNCVQLYAGCGMCGELIDDSLTRGEPKSAGGATSGHAKRSVE